MAHQVAADEQQGLGPGVVGEGADRTVVLDQHPPVDELAQGGDERQPVGVAVATEVDAGLGGGVADLLDQGRQQHLLAAGEQHRAAKGQVGIGAGRERGARGPPEGAGSVGAEPRLVQAGEAGLDHQAVAEELAEVATQRVAVATHEPETLGVRPLGRDEWVAQQEAQRVLALGRLAGGCRRRGHSATSSARPGAEAGPGGGRPAVIAKRKPSTVRLPNALRNVVGRADGSTQRTTSASTSAAEAPASSGPKRAVA